MASHGEGRARAPTDYVSAFPIASDKTALARTVGVGAARGPDSRDGELDP
jgi:hypothetical protein